MPLLNPPGLTLLPDRAVLFRLCAPEASSVRLAADFTRWNAAPLTLERNGDAVWEVRSPPLADGVHFYKYIVDGHWMHDPAHPMVESDGCGGWNSVFALGGPDLGDAAAVRVASLNLHTYQEPEPVLKLEQVAFALAAMDVDAVALQEVGEHTSDPERPNAGEQIRSRLEALTGESWQHAWRMAHIGFAVYREGVSVLARAPLEEVCEYRLSQGRLARNALAATAELKGVRLRLVSTHVTWPTGGGLREVQQLLDAVQAEPRDRLAAVVLAGDFNAFADDPQVREVVDGGYTDVARHTCLRNEGWLTASPQRWQTPSTPELTHPAFLLASRLDYQFLRPTPGPAPLRPLACLPLFNGRCAGDVYQPLVSDHIGVLGVYGT